MMICRWRWRGPLSSRSFARGVLVVWVAVGVLAAPFRGVVAQPDSSTGAPMVWRAWVFGRTGMASSAPVSVVTSGGDVLYSVGGGIAASVGPVLGMARVTDSEKLFVGPGIRDEALLAGLRSRGDRLFVAAAVGLAQATPFETTDGAGTTVATTRTAFAYDLSAHAAYYAAGLALSVSGVVGPRKTSYVLVSLGAEFGWFDKIGARH